MHIQMLDSVGMMGTLLGASSISLFVVGFFTTDKAIELALRAPITFLCIFLLYLYSKAVKRHAERIDEIMVTRERQIREDREMQREDAKVQRSLVATTNNALNEYSRLAQELLRAIAELPAKLK